MVKDHSARKDIRCCHYIGYSFQLAARVVSYAPSHRQDGTYYGLCYISCGTLAGTRNSSMGPPYGIDLMTHHTMSMSEMGPKYYLQKIWDHDPSEIQLQNINDKL